MIFELKDTLTLSITKPFLRRAEHCIGYVTDAPESPVSKWVSSISAIFVYFWYELRMTETQKSSAQIHLNAINAINKLI